MAFTDYETEQLLNMTDSVLSVILYRVSFCFARGAEKKSLIKRGAALQKETLEFR